MTPRRASRPVLALAALGSLVASARAQTCSKVFGPFDREVHVSQSVQYDQIWPQPSRGPTGWTFAWSEGQDVFARRFDAALAPLGAQYKVNTTYDAGIQDEPAIATATNGNVLIAWSDRNGYDGSAMGIFARLYSASGAPLTGEFVVTVNRAASQWRPLLAPTPAGGFVVAWSGDSDGNAYFRVLAQNGAFSTGDVRANVYGYDAQVDPSVAVAPNGTIFVAYLDYSGSSGNGLALFGRTFDGAGNPQQAVEFPITSWASAGSQRDPRVAADGLGRFFVAWEDSANEGAGYGIFARVFNAAGNALAPEFVVDSTIASDQRQPRIAVDALGRALVAWVDFSAGFGHPAIRARRFNAQANPEGPDFVVNESPTTGVAVPAVGMDAGGREMVVAFQGPGALGQGIDVYAKRFLFTAGPHVYCASKPNSLGCLAQVGFQGGASWTSLAPFWISATSAINRRPALLLYGQGSSFAPYYGATICIAPPLRTLPFQTTGGNPTGTDCSGAMSVDFNAYLRSGADPGLIPGSTVGARWYYRDVLDPTGYSTGLSNAVRFAICP
jgi:hypothetical protein